MSGPVTNYFKECSACARASGRSSKLEEEYDLIHSLADDDAPPTAPPTAPEGVEDVEGVATTWKVHGGSRGSAGNEVCLHAPRSVALP